MQITEEFRTDILATHGATDQEIQELLAYNHNIFDWRQWSKQSGCNFPDEAFIEAWEKYAQEAEDVGVFQCLCNRLVQFRFPICQGISQTENYRAAVRRGAPVATMPEASGLILTQPESLRLIVHPSPAGRIPVLLIAHRSDFVSIVQALSMKNEPGQVPDSMGAAMIAGYNNWDRIRSYRKHWEERQPVTPSEEMWRQEFKSLIPRKELYQDRFVLLSDGPYSAVPAAVMGLDTEEWKRISLIIRREHECTHYFTRRLFGAMRNNLFDEILADYAGITAAKGYFDADWLLRFMGLERYPDYRPGARLENYRGEPALSPGAFRVLMTLVKYSAQNLQLLDRQIDDRARHVGDKGHVLAALCRLTLEVLASEKIDVLFWEAFQDVTQGDR
jgi:hypothetical protein